MNGQPIKLVDAFATSEEIIRKAVAMSVAHGANNSDQAFMRTIDMGEIPVREGFWRSVVDQVTGVLTFEGKYYRRGPQVLSVPEATAGSLSFSLTGTATLYIGLQWNTQTGAGTLLHGTAFTDIIDTAVPADSEFIKAPICSMGTDGTSWYEDENFRALLITALYV